MDLGEGGGLELGWVEEWRGGGVEGGEPAIMERRIEAWGVVSGGGTCRRAAEEGTCHQGIEAVEDCERQDSKGGECGDSRGGGGHSGLGEREREGQDLIREVAPESLDRTSSAAMSAMTKPATLALVWGRL